MAMPQTQSEEELRLMFRKLQLGVRNWNTRPGGKVLSVPSGTLE